MKILITEQFNKAVKTLGELDRKRVFKLFSALSELDKKEIFQRNYFLKVSKSKEHIYVIRNKLVRVFCTFEKTETEESLIFLDVIRKSSSKLQIPNHLKK